MSPSRSRRARRIRRYLAACILLCILAGPGRAEQGVVTLANSSWPPYYTQELPTLGIVPEIITAAYARQGDYTVTFSFRPWPRVMAEVDDGRTDGAAAAYYRAGRARRYLYTHSYMWSPIVFYKRRDLPLETWASLEDLKPYRIGLEQGSAYSPAFDAADYLKKETVSQDILNFKKLLAGHIDLMVIDPYAARYYLQKHLPRRRHQLVALEPPLYGNDLHIMFSRNIPDAPRKIAAFNEGLALIRADGTLQKILERYGMAPADKPPGTAPPPTPPECR